MEPAFWTKLLILVAINGTAATPIEGPIYTQPGACLNASPHMAATVETAYRTLLPEAEVRVHPFCLYRQRLQAHPEGLDPFRGTRIN